MKTIIIMAISLTFVAQPIDKKLSATSREMGMAVVSALQQTSVEDYIGLFPSISEFHQIMHENRALYGAYVNEAKQEFTSDYELKIIPELMESFNKVITEGRKRNIEWRNIQFKEIEMAGITPKSMEPFDLTVVFSFQDKEHRLLIEKAILMKGEWKVSQHLRLV